MAAVRGERLQGARPFLLRPESGSPRKNTHSRVCPRTAATRSCQVVPAHSNALSAATSEPGRSRRKRTMLSLFRLGIGLGLAARPNRKNACSFPGCLQCRGENLPRRSAPPRPRWQLPPPVCRRAPPVLTLPAVRKRPRPSSAGARPKTAGTAPAPPDAKTRGRSRPATRRRMASRLLTDTQQRLAHNLHVVRQEQVEVLPNRTGQAVLHRDDCGIGPLPSPTPKNLRRERAGNNLRRRGHELQCRLNGERTPGSP